MEPVKVTGAACRAGRALLRWSTKDLMREAGMSPNTIAALENDEPVRPETEAKVRAAFERAGVELLNGDAPGARLRPSEGGER